MEPGDCKLTPLRHFPAAVAPASLYVALLLLVPVIVLGDLSLHTGDLLSGLSPHATLANYRRLFGSKLYLDALLGSLRLGATVTLLALLAGYPVAFFVARTRSRLVPVVIAVTALPLFVSVVVRSFGWIVLLGREGPVSRLLMAAGLSSGPVRMLNTNGAVTVGLVHIVLPLMILPIASVLRGVDRQLDEAALSLGASRLRVFATVVLPLSLPGVAAGCLLVLAHVIAAFVLPSLIGSDQVKLMATMIYQQVMVVGDVPFGAALALVLVAAMVVLLGLARGLAGRVRS